MRRAAKKFCCQFFFFVNGRKEITILYHPTLSEVVDYFLWKSDSEGHCNTCVKSRIY